MDTVFFSPLSFEHFLLSSRFCTIEIGGFTRKFTTFLSFEKTSQFIIHRCQCGRSRRRLDGDGQPAKRIETRRTLNGSNVITTATTTYYVRSSVLGSSLLVELDAQGNKTKSYVYAAGGRLAKHEPANAIAPVAWYVTEPLTGDWGEAKSNGDFMGDRGANLDPLGADTPPNDPYLLDPTPTYIESRPNEPLYIDGGDPFDLSGGCTLDGLPVSCNFVAHLANSDVAVRAPGQTTRYRDGHYEFFQAFADGRQGFLPLNAHIGDGGWYDPVTHTEGKLQSLALLPNKQNINLIKATDALASKLASGVSEDCLKNVIDKLKDIGFDLNGFINFLGNNPQFYNGVTSTALAAGTVSPKQPADILYGTGATIADVFKGSGNTRPNALTSITSPTFLSFFRPDAISGSGVGTQSLIFHEGIHGFTGKVDADVQNALGIKETPVSQNITEYIKKHCF